MYWQKRFDLPSPDADIEAKIVAIRKSDKDFGYRRIWGKLHVIGIVSGKGGVGKSLVTSLLAVQMQRKGYKTAILDADITGPSIPKIFGMTEKATGDEHGIFPVNTKKGIEVMIQFDRKMQLPAS